MWKPLGAFAVALVLSVSATAARADTYTRPAGIEPNNPTWLQQWDQWVDQFGEQFENWIDGVFGVPDVDANSGGGSGPVAAPELDPAGVIAALTLLAGGLAVVRGRRKPK
jgi:hypothetical protein